ncbi:hypothetical protein [Mycobacterium sp. Marseille-P9652]|uniref:hypothetical protein n=1 Tax=Mycobacterium sp. Marseille-P9652 TaxID=2654950 RepID=UPI0012E85F7C|nr:hypothetical protein [Mycobacterium sp. Marseille-P9652]
MTLEEIQALGGKPTRVLVIRPGIEPSGRWATMYGLSHDKKHVRIRWETGAGDVWEMPISMLERIIPYDTPAHIPTDDYASNNPAIGYDSTREFRDDDRGYLAWLGGNPDGYVINIARKHSATAARMHRARCRTISGQNPHGGPWTGPYVKVCAEQLAELEQWAIDQVGQPIPPCGICRPASAAGQHTFPKQAERAAPPPVPDGRWEINGPRPDSAIVEAWADDYIRFERRPAWQEQLRTEIRNRCRQLEPSAGRVLHATFFGDKLPNADVENLLLYNIDSFAVAGRDGIRFELGAAVPPAPSGAGYRVCYRYSLAPRSGTFADWQQERTLASFDWTDLGAFSGGKKLAQVWLALARSNVEVAAPRTPGRPFTVRVRVRPPGGQKAVLGGLMKGILDGVVCAFQAHTDTAVLPEVVSRIAEALQADPAEIEKLLLDRRRAVLGVVPRLVHPYGEGVKWDPADHLCVAGELLGAEPVDRRWAIKGEVVELSR